MSLDDARLKIIQDSRELVAVPNVAHEVLAMVAAHHSDDRGDAEPVARLRRRCGLRGSRGHRPSAEATHVCPVREPRGLNGRPALQWPVLTLERWVARTGASPHPKS